MVTKAIAGSTRAAAIFIVFTFWVYSSIVGILIYQGFNAAQDRAESSVTAAAKAVTINTGWIVKMAKQALHQMDFALGPDVEPDTPEILTRIWAALDGLPRSAKAYIVNTDGQTLYTTDPNAPNIDVRDREYFAGPAAGQQFFTSSLLISRIDGSPIFTFSRRLERGGVFIGVAIISFDAALLGGLLESLDLGTGSTLAILRSDGMLVAHYPPVDGLLDLTQHALFKVHLHSSDAGTYIDKSPVDGEERFLGYQTVPEAELVAIASVGYSETMDGFWRRVRIFLGIVIPTVLALAACAFWIISLLRRDAQKNEKLKAAFETNTMLFREIHHRVKNNMQAMQALLGMQKLPPDVETNFKLRLAAMATVHEHMYNHDKYVALDAPSFIASVTENIFQAYGSPARLSLDIDQIAISHEQATSLSMLINEVVTNCLKYAVVDSTDAEIRISLKLQARDTAKLIIADNGPGFDPERCHKGMGSKIIKGMVMQLHGSHTYDFEAGTSFSTKFPVG